MYSVKLGKLVMTAHGFVRLTAISKGRKYISLCDVSASK